jgi:CRISPR-associated protein Cas1
MNQLLNTLYVTTPGADLHLDHDTPRVEVERETQMQVPLLHLNAVVCLGDVLINRALIPRCAYDGRSVVLLDRNERFKPRVEGSARGNVLLRREQHAARVTAGGAKGSAVGGRRDPCGCDESDRHDSWTDPYRPNVQ